jgi:hypothetical protein
MKPRIHLIKTIIATITKSLLLEEYDPVLNQPEKEGNPF